MDPPMTRREANAAIRDHVRSWNHQEFAGARPRLDCPMGRRYLLKTVGRKNLLLEAALRHPGEDVVGSRAKLVAVRYVVVEAGARQEQRLAKQQFARIDRRNQPARLAIERQRAACAKRIHAANVSVEPNSVIDNVDAAAARYTFDG